jgi:hypothetical protein
VQVVIAQGVVPEGMVDLIVVALPKGSGQVGGVQGCRPISLYKVILKVATGIVHRKMQAIVARHHLLNDRQIFNVRNRGVHDTLQLVLGALGRAIGRGKAVYVASTDVAGAFPSVPLWYLRYILDGKGATEQTMRFYELSDGSGRFCMTIGGGFSEWAPKSKIGVGQGEKGSPEKILHHY